MVDKSKYDGLAMSPQARVILDHHPDKWVEYCNGVGSPEGGWFRRLTYRLTPDTIWGMDITPASDIHDVEYTVPDHYNTKFTAEEYRHESDMRLRRNIEALADRGWRFLRAKRYARARAYYHIVRVMARDGFYKGKSFG